MWSVLSCQMVGEDLGRTMRVVGVMLTLQGRVVSLGQRGDCEECCSEREHELDRQKFEGYPVIFKIT